MNVSLSVCQYVSLSAHPGFLASLPPLPLLALLTVLVPEPIFSRAILVTSLLWTGAAAGLLVSSSLAREGSVLASRLSLTLQGQVC